jgi:drug/metabolite transporter (DMT)-like permease
MNWFLIALASPLLWSVCNHIDKYQVENFYKKVRPGTLLIFTGAVSLVFSLLILIGKPNAYNIGLKDALIVLFAGVVYFVANLPYILALMKDEASRVIPLFQVQPIYSYILALVFLAESLSIAQLLGGVIILSGSILITLDLDNRFRLKKSVFVLMMLSTALFAIEGFLFKFVGRDVGFWSAAFYQYLGTFLAGLAMFMMPSFRNDLKQVLRQNGKRAVPLSIFNESVNVMARVCFNYASLLAPLALVTLVNGFQPFFVIAIGIAVTLFLPSAGRESLLRKHLAQKLISVIIIFAGTYFLFER